MVHKELRLFVTNYHAIRKFAQVTAMFPQFSTGGTPVTVPNNYLEAAAAKGITAKVVNVDPSRDLALLQADQLPDDVQEIKLAAAPTAPGKTFHSLGAADRVIGFGMEEGVLWRYRTGPVKTVVTHEYRYADGQRVRAQVVEMPATLDPNDCGDPVTDETGRLVGVTCDFGTSKSQKTSPSTCAKCELCWRIISAASAGAGWTTPVVRAAAVRRWTTRIRSQATGFGPETV